MKQAGFTLVEVLAALMVFSVSILGLTHTGIENARAAYVLEQRTLAGIVADNQLSLARIASTPAKQMKGFSTQKNYEFDWELVSAPTDISRLERLIVTVSAKGEEQILIRRIAFRVKP